MPVGRSARASSWRWSPRRGLWPSPGGWSEKAGFPPGWFAFAIGALALRELPVYTRHLQNIIFFRDFAQLRVASGSRMEYPRSLVYRLSTVDMAVAGAFFLVLAGRWGAPSCWAGPPAASR